MLQRTLREEMAEKAAKLPEGDRSDGEKQKEKIAREAEAMRGARETPTDPNSNNTGVQRTSMALKRVRKP